MVNPENQPAPKPIRPAFMDSVEAASILRTDRLAVLKYVETGKLRTFGGKPGNPFVRTEDVDRLAQELAVEELTETPPASPKTVHRNDPVRKIRLRIQQDAKWPEVDEAAIRAWANEIDPISYGRMRQVAVDAIERLQTLIRVLDETEEVRKKPHQLLSKQVDSEK